MVVVAVATTVVVHTVVETETVVVQTVEMGAGMSQTGTK